MLTNVLCPSFVRYFLDAWHVADKRFLCWSVCTTSQVDHKHGNYQTGFMGWTWK